MGAHSEPCRAQALPPSRRKEKTLVCCCGNYRSGSTLIYLIARHLIDYSGCADYMIEKIHEDWPQLLMRPERSILLYSYRDVRDVMASFSQMRSSDFDTFEDRTGKGPRRNVVEFIKFMIRYDINVKRYCNQFPAHTLIFKYETDIIGKTCQLVEKIREFLLMPDDRWSKEIAQNLSFENVKGYTDALVKHDIVSDLHPNHLTDGKTEKYKEVFTEDQINQINGDEEIAGWLIENGYKI